MAEIPNCGVLFYLGSYKVELILNTGYGRSRILKIESEEPFLGSIRFAEWSPDGKTIAFSSFIKVSNVAVAVPLHGMMI